MAAAAAPLQTFRDSGAARGLRRRGAPRPPIRRGAAAARYDRRYRLEELWRGRRRVPPRQRRRARGAPAAPRRAGRAAARSGDRVFLRFRPRRRGFPGVGASGTGAAAACASVAGAPQRSVFRPEIRPATPSGSAEGEEEVRAEKEEILVNKQIRVVLVTVTVVVARQPSSKQLESK